MKRIRSILSLCLVLTVLLAAAALSGCDKQEKTQQTVAAVQTTAEAAPETTTAAPDGRIELGEGAYTFYLDVTKSDGTTSSYVVHSDDQYVGEPLTELGLIAGEESQYGLYVTTVDGETLDYNTDGMYWAFYVDGAYASTGVDTTPITEGATYALTATKG
ncbi:MAG: DUF4430 domain-containing protein [Oscillospiraceae bacterium]|nr:DUF4430 domain-containing protein [Oscillospiraceae bacterium]